MIRKDETHHHVPWFDPGLIMISCSVWADPCLFLTHHLSLLLCLPPSLPPFSQSSSFSYSSLQLSTSLLRHSPAPVCSSLLLSSFPVHLLLLTPVERTLEVNVGFWLPSSSLSVSHSVFLVFQFPPHQDILLWLLFLMWWCFMVT